MFHLRLGRATKKLLFCGFSKPYLDTAEAFEMRLSRLVGIRKSGLFTWPEDKNKLNSYIFLCSFLRSINKDREGQKEKTDQKTTRQTRRKKNKTILSIFLYVILVTKLTLVMI